MRLSFGQEMHSELELILIVQNNIFTVLWSSMVFDENIICAGFAAL